MGWNENLYVYHLERGGTYLGPWDGEWRSQLQLEYQGAPLVVRKEEIPVGRDIVKELVRVFTPLTLERPYELAISATHVLNRALGLVRSGEDFGCPQLSQTRRIRTNEAAFTTQVLRSADLRRRLEQCPKHALSVRWTFDGRDGAHVLETHMDMYDTHETTAAVDWLGQEQARQAQRVAQRKYQPEEFGQELDRLVELAKTARDALTAWRM